ncbi:MAG TPA: hypothetical protein VFM96_13290 [Gaiellaceae bacterium]|nr:hypothetical protein [Gaiellaceae bacterium]
MLTFLGFVLANPPGGSYSASSVAAYLAKGHRVSVLVAMHLALLGVLGLIYLLARLRDVIDGETEDRRTSARVFWGAGLAAAASFAGGWAIVGGQVLAHLEGGSGVVITPPVTHAIGQLGVTFIFGSGAIMLGFALIVLMLNSQTTLPAWLRWLTLVAGLCGIAGLAFFTFFVLLICVIVISTWMLASSHGTESNGSYAAGGFGS